LPRPEPSTFHRAPTPRGLPPDRRGRTDAFDLPGEVMRRFMGGVMRVPGVIMVLALTHGLLGCGHDTTVSPTAPRTPSTPSPTVATVSIAGIVTLTKVGETSQLTATASLSDGTTKDVTSAGKWQWGDARVVTISPS